MTSIGGYAFSDCSGLTSVTIPDSVTSIGGSAFARCFDLTSISIPDSVTNIGSYAFYLCSSLGNITIPANVNSIGHGAFGGCSKVQSINVENGNSSYTSVDGILFNIDQTLLHTYPSGKNGTSYSIPASVTSIGEGAFRLCSRLTNITIPDSVTSIDVDAFGYCDSLTSATIPNSVTSIGNGAFRVCRNLSDVYYGGTMSQWNAIDIGKANNDPLLNATIHYNNTGPNQGNSTPIDSEYIYDTPDPGEDTYLDTERLNSVTNPATAAEVVRDIVSGMTQAQKDSATGTDLATLYAETAVAKAASKPFDGDDILINAAAVAELEAEAAQAASAVDTALINGGISTARYLSSTVTFTTSLSNEISIRIDPDILTTGVDKVRVEGPSYALTFNVADLKDDLSDILTFKAEPVGTAGTALSSGNATAPLMATLLVNRTVGAEPVYLANTGTKAVKVTLPSGGTTNSVTVSLPKDNSKDTTYQAVVNTTGTATSSKYNPATTNIDGKVNTSGTYTVATKEANFTDIANKSVEMQKAIKYLASKGIISGTGGTNYSPDASISRAEIAALIVRALGKLNSSATNSFTDVKSSDWYYTVAGSSQKAGYISGFEDNTFRGTTTINKEQIVAVAARVLINEMHYKTPNNTDTTTQLSKYSDTVVSWAQPQVALATKENLVVYRTDRTFSGTKNMTRGDAAIIIYRLFQKIW